MQSAGGIIGEDALSGARQDVVRAARALSSEGFAAGTGGNVSVRCGELVAVTPTGAALESIRAADVVIVDGEGAVVAGDLQPTSELALHLGAIRRAGAVAHLHPRFATVLACVVEEVPCLHSEMLELGGPVRVAPYRTFGTEELAEVTLAALEGRRAALMSNHGALVVGDDVDHLVRLARCLEAACELYWRAAVLGAPRCLDEVQRAEHLEAARRVGYGRVRPLDR